MDAILSFWCLFFAGDVDRLGAPSFHEREHASRNLVAGGLWAVPALREGLKTSNPERQLRCEILLGQAGWDFDRTAVDNLLWLRGQTVLAASVITYRRKPCDYSEATRSPPEAFLTRVSESTQVSRRVYELATKRGVQFYDPNCPGYGTLPVDKFLALTPTERYWLLWDFGNDKPCATPETIPQVMEKP